MPSSSRTRIIEALARSRLLKVRLSEEYQRLRREFESLEEQKNALKARRRPSGPTLSAA